MNSHDLKKKVALMRERLRRRAATSLFDFIYYVKGDYRANWHHKTICKELNDFFEDPRRRKLMLFVPPQHGKSEIASRCFPAFVLGQNPDCKIALASYSIDLARSFNRDVQRLIDSEQYADVFPGTFLNSKNVATDARGAWLRNSEQFEVVGHKGSFKAVGVLGGLSGRTVDLAIIDDPVKDAIEAESPVYRQRVWDWYTNVLETRLHNQSKVVLIMTRWHEDDLAGRLLQKEGNRWSVIKIPAILEAPEDRHPEDPRDIGAALWPQRHSLEKLTNLRALSETTFQSLYQQNPTTPGGNKVKLHWFEYCEPDEVPADVVLDLWIDGAYTKHSKNDPTGIMIAGFSKSKGKLYITWAFADWLEMPDLLKAVPEFAKAQGVNTRGRIRIEPKASGKSLRQMLNAQTNLSAVEIKGRLVSEGKEARLAVAAPRIEAGKVVLARGNWNEAFTNQITAFPKAKHDEFVDLIGYACESYFMQKKAGVRRRN